MRFISLLALILSLLSCGPRAQVHGEVRDGFGAPLTDVKVSVSGTQFQAVTGPEGQYEVPYAPGRFQITFTKEGYLSSHLDLEVATETTIPAKQIVLIKVPQEPGIYHWGSNDYMTLGAGKLTFKSVEHPFSWDGPLYTDSYAVDGEFVRIDTAASELFLDTFPKPMALFSVGSQGRILVREKAWLNTSDDATVISEKTERLADGMLRREVDLPPGRYAFAQVSRRANLNARGRSGGPSFGAVEGHPVLEPVFLFEIVRKSAGAR